AGVFLEIKNWPPFFPIIHHDIANEIPDYLHRVQYVAFATLLGMILCLVWNVISVSAASLKGRGRIYISSLIFAVHICFCIFAAVAPPIFRQGFSLP
ncbi:hypothetical protein Gotri_016216, partial [Gossypium trilobum]|nr:hypothetical protein [Gossypium trilobum]